MYLLDNKDNNITTDNKKKNNSFTLQTSVTLRDYEMKDKHYRIEQSYFENSILSNSILSTAGI